MRQRVVASKFGLRFSYDPQRLCFGRIGTWHLGKVMVWIRQRRMCSCVPVRGEAQAFPVIRLFTGIGTMADTVAGAFTDSRSIILVFSTSRLGGPA